MRAAWQQVRAALKDEIGESAFNSWVEPLTLISTVQGVVRLAAPSRFMRDRVEGNYGRRLRELWRESLSDFWGLELVLAPTPRARTVHPPLNRLGYPPVISYKIHPATATWNERFRFDSFLEGESNKFVLGMSKRIADGVSSPGSFFFHSRVGLGKTHLLHAIGHSCTLHRPDLLVGYITAERFLQEFVRSLRQREAIAFKDSLSRLDVLLLDDLQFIGHAPQAQQELSHLVSSLLARGSSVVVTADCEFGQIRGLSDRLRSRLCGGAVGEIASPDRDLRVRILLTRSEELGFSLPEDVLNLLAERIVASVRELEGGLKRLYANSQITGEQITVEMAYTVLRDLLSPLRKRVTILDIQRCVARHFDLQMEDMFSAKRDRRVVRPRQVAMFLAKSLTVHSLPEIGRHFGGRDHTTVLYAIRRIEDLRSRDSALDREIEDLGHELQR
ncbi:MAG: chromosomal replication initiator protein DnaA [Alphaproteobacteria bacterium]